MSKTPKNSRLVYSTDQGRIKPEREAEPPPEQTDGIVRIARETKGRKGKGVSLISGLPAAQQKELAKLLKQKLGVGGAVKAGVVEIQSDDRSAMKQLLESKGFTVKLAGG